MDYVLGGIIGSGILFFIFLFAVAIPDNIKTQRDWTVKCVQAGGEPHIFRREDDLCLKPGTIIEVR